ncbi:MAG TPA: nickel transporter [Steroidobacteraceae bacterium]|nr:nickel transporter [Steroidobacteraceae bacterium]
MPSLPTDFGALTLVVFLLGARHGLDADHLATIDGLTRVGSRRGARHARFAGALFSLGHGAVVVAIAALVGAWSARWQTPAWLEQSGLWISVFFLTLLGVVNLRAVLVAAPSEVVAPVGIKGRFLGRLAGADRPATVLLVGALFALSFDTISQAALFAVAGARFGGVPNALVLGSTFLAGMLLTDGCNGLLIARLLNRSDALARVASRAMGLAVGVSSLAVAALGVARAAAPAFAAWSAGRELEFGAAVIALVVGSFVGGRWLARRRPALGRAA